MASSNENTRNQWAQIANELADDLASTTDEELLLELKDDGVDISAEATRIRNLISGVIAEHGKEKLAAARSEMDLRNRQEQDLGIQITQEIRSKLTEYIKAGDSTITGALTIAARNGAELSEEDLDEVIHALFDLGKIDEHGNLL